MTATPEAIAAMRAMLAATGVTIDDLKAAPGTQAVPTVAEYLPVVKAATTAKAARTFDSYWTRLVTRLGSMPLDQVKPSDVSAFAIWCQENAVSRSNSVGGVGAHTNALTVARAFWKLAVADGHCRTNPALEVPKLRRNPRPRRALDAAELADLERVTRTTGNDPDLDALLLRFHLETGARREGALNLAVRDLDQARQTVTLDEKGDKRREVPVSGTLMAALLAHTNARAVGPVVPSTPVFHYRRPYAARSAGTTPTTALTRKRYNYLADRWHRELPWAAALGVSAHWLRHTALTDTERLSGEAVAAALAGHVNGSVTAGYTRATLPEVVHALELRTGEPHPLGLGVPCPCHA